MNQEQQTKNYVTENFTSLARAKKCVEKEQLTLEQLVMKIHEGEVCMAYVIIVDVDGVMSEYKFTQDRLAA